jgi:leader peptidase (prepilin peptidase)/N-methyltransferase
MPVDIENLLLAPFSSTGLAIVVFATAGGLLTALLTHVAMVSCELADRNWSKRAGALGLLLCAIFVGAMLRDHCQETPMVRPSALWWYWRIGHHVVLIALMVALAATDLRAYVIPDLVTMGGLAWGLGLAIISGDLQIEHAWCDWNQEVPQIAGAYIPRWMSEHPHLHGLVWSVAGALAAAGGIWAVRGVSSAVIGQETMGLGDVTLMAMIGSFLGWQPVVFVVLLAPLCAVMWQVAGGISSRLARGVISLVRRRTRRLPSLGAEPDDSRPEAFRPYSPYGPYLCLATYVVLLAWRRIWMFELSFGQAARPDDRLTTFAVRRLFGDWVSLAVIVAGMLGGLTVLLVVRRAYRAIPVTRRTTADRRCAGSTPTDVTAG